MTFDNNFSADTLDAKADQWQEQQEVLAELAEVTRIEESLNVSFEQALEIRKDALQSAIDNTKSEFVRSDLQAKLALLS
jgi:hypothetical protein